MQTHCHIVKLLRYLQMNKAQQAKRGIKHWGLSGYSNILPHIKFGVTGQESSSQSPTISYHQRCHLIKRK